MRRQTREHFARAVRGGVAARLGVILAALQLVACSGDATGPAASITDCSIPLDRFTDGGVDRSGIPALTNPRLAKRLAAPDVGYVLFSDLVIGVQFNGQPLAIPLKLLWYHEVVNFEVPGQRLTVTHSPLTGSSVVFDPASTGTGDFTVSRYLLGTNLVMEDGSGTLFPQMTGLANCGPHDGASLARVPYEQMSYRAWLSVFPDTWVASRITGFDFLYTLYPYGDYRNPNNRTLLYPISSVIDSRRPPKERVIGVPSGTGGVAFPLSVLAQVAFDDQVGQQVVFVWAANAAVGGEPVVAFWNSLAGSALVYRATVGGQSLTFEVVDGTRRDVETGSTWDFSGFAVSGPMAGTQLAPHPDAYHAFWFAWADVQPDTEIWAPAISPSSVAGIERLRLPPEPIDWSLARR